MSIIIGPATCTNGDPGIRLYCPRCDADLGTWPCIDLRHAQHEADQHTVHGLELLREANQAVIAEALTEYYARRPITTDPDSLATVCTATGPQHLLQDGTWTVATCIQPHGHAGLHVDGHDVTWA